ncbi:MAG: shikimate kinase [Simkaniaceae bacterium]|nr:shikimate kinase [Candidatus Sacchlamyda saccharinae]
MNWILFGFKGAGKSYFAKRLGLPYIDTDQLIEDELMSPQQLVLQKGMKNFRAVEKKTIASLTPSNTVIAVGGGAVLDLENLTNLRKLGTLIYLKCPKELLKKRFENAQTTFTDFEKLYATRIPKYETIAAKWIEIEGKTDQEIIEAIWEVINLEKSLASPPGASLTAKP